MELRERQLANSAEDVCPLLVGTPITKLTRTTVDGSSFDLNAAIAEKPTILTICYF